MINSNRKQAFKKTVDPSEARDLRNQVTVVIRKKRRVSALNHRRGIIPLNDEELQAARPLWELTGDDLLRAIALKRDVLALANPNSDFDGLFGAAQFFRYLSFREASTIDSVVESNVLDGLGHVLRVRNRPTGRDSFIQREVLWALCKIAASRAADVFHAVPLDLISPLIMSENRETSMHAAGVLGSIADAGEFHRLRVLSCADVVEALVLQVERAPDKDYCLTVISAIRSLSGYGRHINLDRLLPLFESMRRFFMKDLEHREEIDDKLIAEAAWALANLIELFDSRIQCIVDSGILVKMTRLLSKDRPLANAPIARCLAFIAKSSNSVRKQAVLDAFESFLSLEEILAEGTNDAKCEVCWLAYYIFHGTLDQMHALSRKDDLHQGIIKLAIDSVWEVKKAALCALSKLCIDGTDSDVMRMVGRSQMLPFIKFLGQPNGEENILLEVLGAMERILSVGEAKDEGTQDKGYNRILESYGGFEVLEHLQFHKSEKVYKKTSAILCRFVELEDEENIVTPETTDEDGNFQFGVVSPPSAKKLFSSPTPLKESKPAPSVFGNNASNRRIQF